MLQIFKISETSFEVFDQGEDGRTLHVYPAKFSSYEQAQAFLTSQLKPEMKPESGLEEEKEVEVETPKVRKTRKTK